MALLSALTASGIARLGATYGLDFAEVRPLRVGSVNSNFRLVASGGSVFFGRIYEEQDAEGASSELRLLEELAEAGVPTARPLRCTSGALLCEHEGKPFALYPWVNGDILCQAKVTPAACERVGEALARVHLASASSSPLSEGRFRVEDLARRLAVVRKKATADLVRAALIIEQRLETYASKRDLLLPRGVIHGDLFRDNVLWSDGSIRALLDFESASSGPFVYDIGVALLAWCYGASFDLDLMLALLRGYMRQRPLSSAELAGLEVETALGCLRFATTRITDFSMRAPAGQPPERDYRRFLDRLAAVDGGVLARLLARLPG